MWEFKSASGQYSSEAGGRVSYTHAGGIDRPLAIWKQGVGSIVTHQNWRGQFARGTFGAGTRAGQLSDCTTYPPSNGCIPVAWPGYASTAWHEGVANPPTAGYEHYWMGSLAVGMRDASGQMYMRNRYYDPQTGQFTQMDPIGLAGGLNSYGFAAGDPVTYSDPYGLCPKTLRLAPAAAADGPVPAVDAVLAAACVVELGIIGFRWYRTARAAEALLSTSNDGGEGEDEASTGNSPENAPGQTAGGRATDEHGNVLGPSGRPAVHQRNHPTRKRAQDAARNEGQGPPVHHPNPTRGDPHFHPADRNGNKLPTSTHHNYPRP